MLMQQLTAIYTRLVLFCLSRTLSGALLVDHQVAQEWSSKVDKENFSLAVEQTQIHFQLQHSENRFRLEAKPNTAATVAFRFNSYRDFSMVLRRKLTLVEAIGEGRVALEGSLEAALRLIRTLEKCFIYLFPAHVAKTLVTRYKRPSNFHITRLKIFLLPRRLQEAIGA